MAVYFYCSDCGEYVCAYTHLDFCPSCRGELSLISKAEYNLYVNGVIPTEFYFAN